jgi:CMP-2-keto-3-deoxyoctulosonic acid synthetase
MIEHVYRRAAAARGVDAVVVATDDERIASAVTRLWRDCCDDQCGASHRHRSHRGSGRRPPMRNRVNLQGDEPLIEPETIDAVIAPLMSDPMLEMSTVVRRHLRSIRLRQPERRESGEGPVGPRTLLFARRHSAFPWRSAHRWAA